MGSSLGADLKSRIMTSSDQQQIARLELEVAKLKELLRERNRMDEILKEAFVSNQDLITVANMRTAKILIVNDASERITGYSKDEWSGQPVDIHDIWVDKKAKDQFAKWIGKDNRGDYFETILRRKDGSTFPALISGNMVHFENEHFSVTSIRDIGPLRKTEQQLTDSNLKFSLIFQASHAPMILFSVEPRVLIDANSAANSLLKYDDDFVASGKLTWSALQSLWLVPEDRELFRQEPNREWNL